MYYQRSIKKHDKGSLKTYHRRNAVGKQQLILHVHVVCTCILSSNGFFSHRLHSTPD